MARHEWLRRTASILEISLATMEHIYAEAKSSGLVAPGARGVHSRPFDMRERKNLLELVVASMVTKRVTGITLYMSNCNVTWTEKCLIAERIGSGIKVSAIIERKHLEQLLSLTGAE